jgi:uncharacterized membrane protein
MEAVIIILAYLGNIFLNRWLNKIDYKKYHGSIEPFIWFIPIIGTVVFLVSLVGEWKNNWFTGKNW